MVEYWQLVDLTRLFAMGRLDFLLRVFDLVWLLLPLVGVVLSAPSLRSLSQSSTLPILIAIESLSVDTRLPYMQKCEKREEKSTHTWINYCSRDLQSNLCIFFCWLNCNNWLKLIQIAQKWMHRESREGKRKAPVVVTRLHWNDRKFYWFIHCNNVNTINCLRLMRVYQNSKSQKTRISSVVE